MARVFMSVLGASNYEPCAYFLESENRSFATEPVRFIQEATVTLNCLDWTLNDRILIFTTDKAFENNWLDNGHNGNYAGLQHRLAGLPVDATILAKRIPDGKDRDQIQTIFETIIDNLHQEDDVVFDITHGFRSLPMLAMVALNYAKVLKGVRILGIFYGAYEARIGDRAPIFDLTPFDDALNWALAVDRFLLSGDATLASELANSGRIGTEDGSVITIARKMKEFTEDLATCRGLNFSRNARELRASIGECKRSDLPLYVRHLLEHLDEGLTRFEGNEISDGIAAARWCLDHHLIQQGFTILQETLISHLVVKCGLDHRQSLSRQLASQAVHCLNKQEEEWKSPASENKSEIRKFHKVLRDIPRFKKSFKAIYAKLGNFRNDIDHSGFVDKPSNSSEFEGRLEKLIRDVTEFIQSTACE